MALLQTVIDELDESSTRIAREIQNYHTTAAVGLVYLLITSHDPDLGAVWPVFVAVSMFAVSYKMYTDTEQTRLSDFRGDDA